MIFLQLIFAFKIARNVSRGSLYSHPLFINFETLVKEIIVESYSSMIYIKKGYFKKIENIFILSQSTHKQLCSRTETIFDEPVNPNADGDPS